MFLCETLSKLGLLYSHSYRAKFFFKLPRFIDFLVDAFVSVCICVCVSQTTTLALSLGSPLVFLKQSRSLGWSFLNRQAD